MMKNLINSEFNQCLDSLYAAKFLEILSGKRIQTKFVSTNQFNSSRNWSSIRFSSSFLMICLEKETDNKLNICKLKMDKSVLRELGGSLVFENSIEGDVVSTSKEFVSSSKNASQINLFPAIEKSYDVYLENQKTRYGILYISGDYKNLKSIYCIRTKDIKLVAKDIINNSKFINIEVRFDVFLLCKLRTFSCEKKEEFSIEWDYLAALENYKGRRILCKIKYSSKDKEIVMEVLEDDFDYSFDTAIEIGLVSLKLKDLINLEVGSKIGCEVSLPTTASLVIEGSIVGTVSIENCDNKINIKIIDL